MAKLQTIEGIGPAFAEKLEGAGLCSVEDLLQKGATPNGRQELAAQTGLAEKKILGWVNQADLMRISGVGEEYADLLEQSGVDTVIELAQRNPQNLLQKMLEVNAEKKLVRQTPSLKKVAGWVEQAKELPRVVSY
ncbi:MAG: DUF4332 domain-containing protein [Chloroflexia bacterium]|nr:DUF4332 domain-containing protein [Chloroflexia bacterium]